VAYDIADRTLFNGLNFIISAGMRVGLVGPNGSGKTTLLRILRGELTATRGQIRRAEWLRVVYFDQSRELDPDVTLRRALAPESDSVVYQDRVTQPACGQALWGRTGARADCSAHAAAGGPPAAR
jgi:ATP-binding cassette subfamily F protein uup